MLGQYMASLRQLTLRIDVAVAELLLRHLHTSLAVSVPNHFAPMVATAVDCAAVVENHTLNISICHFQPPP